MERAVKGKEKKKWSVTQSLSLHPSHLHQSILNSKIQQSEVLIVQSSKCRLPRVGFSIEGKQ